MAYLLSRAARTFVPSPRSLLPNILHYSATKSYSNHARMLANRQPRSIIIHSQCLPRTSLTTRDFSSSAPVAVKRQKKYKLKTNHAAAARWKALANRMYKRRRAGKSHFNVKKSPAQLNRLGTDAPAVPYHVKHLKRLLPYA